MVSLLKSEEQYDAYFCLLLNFLEFKIEELLIKSFSKRTLIIIERHIAFYKIPITILKKNLGRLYTKLLNLVNSRYNRLTTDDTPLWYEAGICLINISGFIIDPEYKPKFSNAFTTTAERISDPGSFKRELNETNSIENPKLLNIRNSINPETKQFSFDYYKGFLSKEDLTEDKELKQIVWNITLKSFKEILAMNENSLLTLEKELAEEVIRKSQDLGIDIINFINSILIQKQNDKHKELIDIIEIGSITFIELSRQGFSNFCSDLLSRRCLDILMEICKESNELSKIATPILIERCKVIMREYLAGEKHSGLIPLSR